MRAPSVARMCILLLIPRYKTRAPAAAPPPPDSPPPHPHPSTKPPHLLRAAASRSWRHSFHRSPPAKSLTIHPLSRFIGVVGLPNVGKASRPPGPRHRPTPSLSATSSSALSAAQLIHVVGPRSLAVVAVQPADGAGDCPLALRPPSSVLILLRPRLPLGRSPFIPAAAVGRRGELPVLHH